MKKRKRKQLGSVRGDLYFPFEAHRPFTGGPHLGLTSHSLFALGWAGSCSLATENQQAPAQPPGLPGALASAVPKQGKVPGAGGLLWWGEVKGTVMERRGREAMYDFPTLGRKCLRCSVFAICSLKTGPLYASMNRRQVLPGRTHFPVVILGRFPW